MKLAYDPGDLRGVELTPERKGELRQITARFILSMDLLIKPMRRESPARIADRRHAFRDPEPPTPPNLQKWARRLANEGN